MLRVSPLAAVINAASPVLPALLPLKNRVVPPAPTVCVGVPVMMI